MEMGRVELPCKMVNATRATSVGRLGEVGPAVGDAQKTPIPSRD